ncbi:hypothetical protein Taro_030712 [Colocasia esculenta]|uniref:O-fucosyltransferase family protein n=1 Tax=Colocasia esculenta TaxID=4460 RepID=A0A843VWX2_COLES|nr:hypothetical protein [Colocasia esculenta]
MGCFEVGVGILFEFNSPGGVTGERFGVCNFFFSMGKEDFTRNLHSSSFKEKLLPMKPHFFTKENCHVRYSDPCLSGQKAVLVHGPKSDTASWGAAKVAYCGKKKAMICKRLKAIALVLVCFLILDSLMLSVFHHFNSRSRPYAGKIRGSQKGKNGGVSKETQKVMYERLHTLALNMTQEVGTRQNSPVLWDEPYEQASLWKPCANKHDVVHQDFDVHPGNGAGQNGFILVSANGGLNQQRVAVCNAVVVATLLNSTLVLPRFLYSSVWKDDSQFGDIYQEDYFINFLKDDLNIVKELPYHLQSLDIEGIGSQITDEDLMKESEPIHFIQNVLPLLLRNGVIHFLGFGNRLGFDPMPSNLQRLRCKCNFHALKFVPKIQEVGSLLVQRIRRYDRKTSELDEQLLGDHISSISVKESNAQEKPYKYLALHLRFEMDMVAYSLCDFGGGENERKELQAYREIHFPLLLLRMRKNNSSTSPEELRRLGKCPLTPEEAALVLSAIGFKPETYIYLAGSHIYGGKSRLLPLMRLYPNLVRKEDLLTESELAPFKNFSSQMAALDFIACATADVFAMTDSGSQLSSLVTGFRIYHGRGHAPTLRPNKKRLAKILSENSTIEWSDFADRVKKMIDEGQRVHMRHRGRSSYRQPRSSGCMCKALHHVEQVFLQYSTRIPF